MAEGLYFIVKKRAHNEKLSRCVFSISKKVFKKAVTRNKIRRQARVIIKNAGFYEKPITIIPKKDVLGVDFRGMEEDLKKILK